MFDLGFLVFLLSVFGATIDGTWGLIHLRQEHHLWAVSLSLLHKILKACGDGGGWVSTPMCVNAGVYVPRFSCGGSMTNSGVSPHLPPSLRLSLRLCVASLADQWVPMGSLVCLIPPGVLELWHMLPCLIWRRFEFRALYMHSKCSSA